MRLSAAIVPVIAAAAHRAAMSMQAHDSSEYEAQPSVFFGLETATLDAQQGFTVARIATAAHSRLLLIQHERALMLCITLPKAFSNKPMKIMVR